MSGSFVAGSALLIDPECSWHLRETSVRTLAAATDFRGETSLAGSA